MQCHRRFSFCLATSQASQRKARPGTQRTQMCLIPFCGGTAGSGWLSTLRSTASCGPGVTPRSLAQCQVPEHPLPRKSCSPWEAALPVAQTQGDLGCRGRREVASPSLCTPATCRGRSPPVCSGPPAAGLGGTQPAGSRHAPARDFKAGPFVCVCVCCPLLSAAALIDVTSPRDNAEGPDPAIVLCAGRRCPSPRRWEPGLAGMLSSP